MERLSIEAASRLSARIRVEKGGISPAARAASHPETLEMLLTMSDDNLARQRKRNYTLNSTSIVVPRDFISDLRSLGLWTNFTPKIHGLCTS